MFPRRAYIPVIASARVLDTIGPSVVITCNKTSPAEGVLTFTATFSEAVTGFTIDGWTIGQGTKSNFQTISTSVYTVDVTPTAWNVTADVLGNVCQDAAGNNNAFAIQLPIIAIINLLTNGGMETGSPPSNWTAGGSATLTSVADERTGGSGSKSLQIANGATVAGTANQNITGVANGRQVTVKAYAKKIDTNAIVRIVDGSGILVTTSSTDTNWALTTTVATIVNNSVITIRLQNTNSTIGLSTRFDDVVAYISG